MELDGLSGGPVVSAEAELRARLEAELPRGLLAHIDRVVAIADELARRHELDVGLTRLMAQAHDVARAVPPEELLRRAEAMGLTIDAVERAVPVLLHGPVGAIELRARLDVSDERVLHAAHWHTSGHPEYPLEAWAMFLADKVDPAKVERWPALARVAALAERSLEGAALAFLDLSLGRQIEEHGLILPAMVVTRNALIARGVRPE